MSLFDSLIELGTAPIRMLGEVVDDLSENNSEEEKYLAWLTLGTSSLVKGAVKTIEKANRKLDE